MAKSLQKTYRLQNISWVVMSWILWWKIKWNGQRLTGTAPPMPASWYLGKINMAERSASKDEEDKCSCQRFFFLNTNHSALRENKCEERPITFSLPDMYRETLCMLSDRREDSMSLETECKIFEGWTALSTFTCCSTKVHSYHKALIEARSGRMWRVT